MCVCLYLFLKHLNGLFKVPTSVWLSGFFNPQSFLTAIMQSTARKHELPLDKMCLQCDVTKKHKEEFRSVRQLLCHISKLRGRGTRRNKTLGPGVHLLKRVHRVVKPSHYFLSDNTCLWAFFELAKSLNGLS